MDKKLIFTAAISAAVGAAVALGTVAVVSKMRSGKYCLCGSGNCDCGCGSECDCGCGDDCGCGCGSEENDCGCGCDCETKDAE